MIERFEGQNEFGSSKCSRFEPLRFFSVQRQQQERWQQHKWHSLLLFHIALSDLMKSCLVHCSGTSHWSHKRLRDPKQKQFLLFMLDLTPSTSVWLKQMAHNLWIFRRICFPTRCAEWVTIYIYILYFLTGFESSRNIATRPNVHACKCWWTSIGAFVSPNKKVQHWISSLNTKLTFDEHHIKAVVNSNDRNKPWFLHVYLSWRYIWFQLNTKHKLWCIFAAETGIVNRFLRTGDFLDWIRSNGQDCMGLGWSCFEVGPAWPHGRKSNYNWSRIIHV